MSPEALARNAPANKIRKRSTSTPTKICAAEKILTPADQSRAAASVSSQLLPLQSPTLNLSTRTPTLRKNRLVMLLAVIATRAATPKKLRLSFAIAAAGTRGAENSRAPAKTSH